MAVLRAENISKYIHGFAGSGQLILEDLNFEINVREPEGCISTILAPFGAGKTTLLRILAAVDHQTSGKIFLEEKEYNKPNGSIVYIPEKPSSFPWLNVTQNINFAINLKNKNADKEKLNSLISFAGLTGYEDHFPDDKSLGFRFRISLVRALAVEPKLIILDDPLKNLHGETKHEIKLLIKKAANDFKVPLLITTTNVSESIDLSNEIFLMKKHPGKIIGNLKIDRHLIAGKDGKYFEAIKHQIEESFSGHENSLLVSETGNR